MRRAISFTAALIVAAAAAAQSEAVPARTAGPFPTPIVSGSAAGERWAAGAGYKVAFDAGMTFHPVLGPDARRNLPMRWATTEVVLGERALLAGDAAFAERRVREGGVYELVHAGLVERYEVRADGVAQSWSIERPARPFAGDLVVRGTWTGALHAVPFGAPRHGSIVFCDASGGAVVEYGAATAIDASGRTLPLETGFDGREVTIRVPAAWIETAAWPVVVDPLTIPRTPFASSQEPVSTSVSRDHQQDRNLFAFVRATSAADFDVLAWSANDAFQDSRIVFVNFRADESTRSVSTAYTPNDNALLVAYDVVASGVSEIRVYVHDAADPNPGTGSEITVPRVGLDQDSAPSLGGSSSPYAYLGFLRDQSAVPSDTANTQAMGARVNVALMFVEAPQPLYTGPGSDHDAAAIQVCEHSAAFGFLAVWQQYNNSIGGDDWDILAQRIDFAGNLLGSRAVADPTSSAIHRLTPVVAGEHEDFAVSWVERPNTGAKNVPASGRTLKIQRIVWPQAQNVPALGTPQTLVSTRTDTLELGLGCRGMAFDRHTDAHWALAWRHTGTRQPLHVARIGDDMQICETDSTLGDPDRLPSLTYDVDAGDFVLGYVGDRIQTGAWRLRMSRFEYRDARSIPYGSGCVGQIDAVHTQLNDHPYKGSSRFAIRLQNGQPGVPTWLLVSLASTRQPLPAAAAPGCELLVDLGTLQAVGPLNSSPGGSVFIPFAIPSTIPDVDLFWQFVQLVPGGLVTSDGLQTRIR